MDPVQWELELFKADFKESKDAALDSGFDHADAVGFPDLEPKLTVKEQARQFEQQALQEMYQRQNRGSRGSLSPDFLLSVFPEISQPYKQSPVHNVLVTPAKEGPPSIIVTHSDGATPPPSYKPTPPVLRRFGGNLTSVQTGEDTLQVHLEIIPDPPSSPAPPPPPPLTAAPSPPSSPQPRPLLSPPPPPPLPPPVSLSQSEDTENLAAPPPPPPPLPPPPPPLSPSFMRPSTFVLPSLSKVPALRPVSLRPPPPPRPKEAEPQQKELKGILKNIQNIAEIEKSVANMFSQIDQKQIPLKKVMKSQASVESLDSLASLDAVTPAGGGGGGGGGTGAGSSPPAPQIQPNQNMNSIVEELEKKFPSQSTMF